MFDPAVRMIWDKKNLESFEVSPTDHPNVTLPYYLYKKVTPISQKQYSDKQIVFGDAATGVIYSYTTTNELAASDTPLKNGVDFCDSIIGIQKWWRDAESGKICSRVLSQTDGKLVGIPNFILKMFDSKKIEEWFK